MISLLIRVFNGIPSIRNHTAAKLTNAQIIHLSGMFDSTWYLKNNPDVQASGMDPIDHYEKYGANEGRAAGPSFDTAWYLQQNPDVRESGMNPLVHYVYHGRAEGRPTICPVDTSDCYRSPFLSSYPEDLLTDRLMSHPVRSSFEHLQIGSSPAIDLPDRISIAERLLTAYQKARNDEVNAGIKREGEDMWTEILRKEVPELIRAIEEGNAKNLAESLMNFGAGFVWFGGLSTSIDGYNRNLDRSHIALTYWDKLLRVAEYIGVLGVENPEAGPWGEVLELDPEELVSRIESAIGISIASPLGIVHVDGLQIGDMILHYRHINALYASLRILHLSSTCERKSIAEYGGGLGLTALYARRLGINDYTIFDIPFSNLICGHYLLQVLGADKIQLYGEPVTRNTVKLLPYWCVSSVPDKQFALSLNQDGFNEYADNLRIEYRTQIKRTTSSYFLSFNHETFFPKTVSELMFEDPDYQKISRSPYWPREGYVEELYLLK